jgi:hypothetical protein
MGAYEIYLNGWHIYCFFMDRHACNVGFPDIAGSFQRLIFFMNEI